MYFTKVTEKKSKFGFYKFEIFYRKIFISNLFGKLETRLKNIKIPDSRLKTFYVVISSQ